MNKLPKPLTEEEIQDIKELFVMHNHAINMDRINNSPPIPWYKNNWYHRTTSYIKEWNREKNPFYGYKIVDSVEEYSNLPWREKSVWYFWYKTPIISRNGKSILGINGIFGSKKERKALDDFIKTNHPIQHFIRKVGFTFRCQFTNFYDWLDNMVNPRQRWLTKQIPSVWCDKTNLIPMVNFAIVVDFVEGEDAINVVDWESSSHQASEFQKQLKDCYDYIKIRRPKIQNDYENSYPDEETMTGEYFVDYAEHNRLEILLKKEDARYLTWIVVNRGFFWT